MNKNYYSIYDKIAGTYGQLVGADNDEVVWRDLQTLLQIDKKSVYALHPDDFAVYCIGTFGVTNGIFDLQSCPTKVFELLDVSLSIKCKEVDDGEVSDTVQKSL